MQLESARSAGDTVRVARPARERQAYLDELDRHDRAGFAAWLTSGARAGGVPHRYLSGEGAARPGPTDSYLDPGCPDTAHRHGRRPIREEP